MGIEFEDFRRSFIIMAHTLIETGFIRDKRKKEATFKWVAIE